MTELPLSDIQGFVLRTYAMPALRVFAFEVRDAALARACLGRLVNGDPTYPQIAAATTWSATPEACINVALTFSGLAALGVPSTTLASFPEEFMEGAVRRADRVGDTGTSAPATWIGDLASDRVHLLFFVFAQSEAAMAQTTIGLRRAFEGALADVSVHDARSLPGDLAHFGYRDGFAQPNIEGGLSTPVPDVLPKAPAGAFLLGHQSQYADFTYPVPQPTALGTNGSFVAFRVLEQDCHGFEQFLTNAASQTGLDRELIAAKLCGRWRNGVPLSLSPESPDPNLPLASYNAFDYVPTDTVPDVVDDRRGHRCPIGSHIRRMNPRHSAVAGNSGLKRRIVRRGLPYGPPYDPAHPGDGIARGLLGLFIGVSLKDQFEFLMSDWANGGRFAPGLRDTRDPVMGDNASPPASFLIPRQGQPTIELTGFSRFVTCRGGVYGFLPSLTALRFLAT